jgi:hypothetical protein
MMETNPASEFFLRLWTQLLPQLPLYLVWLIGLFLALVRWRRHPMPSLLATIAFVLFLVGAMVGTLLFAWVLSQQHDAAWRAEVVGWMISLIALGRTAVSTVAWVLLLIALFGWRSLPSTSRVPRYEPIDEVQPAAPDTGIRTDRPE